MATDGMKVGINKVLVVDDDPEITGQIKCGLELNGFAVDACEDPIEAFASFNANIYDVIIIDIRMPKLNGFDLFRKIREKDKKAKVFFLTAFEINCEEFRKMFPRIDVHAFARKPPNISELIRQIGTKEDPTSQ